MNKPNQYPSVKTLRHVFKVSSSSPSGLLWQNPPGVKLKAGACAGSIGRSGYYSVQLQGKTLQVHRIVLIMTTGEDHLEKCADHIDRNRLNNSPNNLRWATPSENMKNRAVKPGSIRPNRPLSQAGCRGVSLRPNGKFQATGYPGKVCLGTFSSAEDAAAAVNSWRKTQGLKPY
jgi:hypothetical protein